jgi:hypothetical protein
MLFLLYQSLFFVGQGLDETFSKGRGKLVALFRSEVKSVVALVLESSESGLMVILQEMLAPGLRQFQILSPVWAAKQTVSAYH